MRKRLIVLFIFAFFIRIISLNQSLWLDEGTTVKAITHYNYIQILTNFSPFDFHPPLYYFFLKFWSSFFGTSEIVLRLPSIIFSLMTGYIVYLVGKKLYRGPSTGSTTLTTSSLRTNFSEKSEKFGFWAAVFFLLNPLIVYYSQEARMYMMATFFLTAAFYFLIQSLNKKHETKNIILYNLFIGLSFLTFYGSVFLILTFLSYLILKKEYKLFLISFFSFVFIILITSPLLLPQYLNSAKALEVVVNWKQVLGKADLKNLLLIPIKFSIGKISFYPKYLYYLISFFWLSIILLLVFKDGLKNKKILFFALFPILLGLLFSLYSPLLQYFRFLYLIPLLSLFYSLSINKHYQRLILACGFLIFSLAYLVFSQFHREDWRSLSQYIQKIKSEKVYMITSSSDAIKYYNPKIQINDLNDLKSLPLETKILIIPYTADIYRLNYTQLLVNMNYRRSQINNFRGLTLETWVK